ncbi:OmpA family protein [Marinomonas rhodophyticola]|uniref:OmpA family protein n=1 Tax=Marinomonas rhodophyticola TaxID=2992803 RepID=A0ABT3KGV0_9GAMM|nr:OmpA family protein [Marinomonas sp. KJ51-3]MCW4629769.1 OmpA family protein [Marinomonas sp. KJ51-3]
MGYQIDSGQLDLDLKLKSKNGILDGTSHVLLREFDLGGRQDSSTVIKAGAVPLNIAVSVLKDSDNNIGLDIPLSGDIENPAFGWQDFLLLPVRKALFSASSTYLMQTFVPYANVISIAQFAGDQLLRIRVEPLIFTAEDSNLNESQAVFLQQLSALMKDKKDSQLKACGIASYLDLGLPSPPVSIDDESKEKARVLAQKRADHLKDYLVNEGIASSRIFFVHLKLTFPRAANQGWS